MIINCFRCGKPLDSPDAHNADYVIAEDTIVSEPRETLFALSEGDDYASKVAKMEEVDKDGNLKYPELAITDEDYVQTEIPDVKSAVGAVKIIAKMVDKAIQKTGVICPECYRETDIVIWGVHKK